MELDEEEKCCRYCLDTDGDDLISPCHCKGGQKWVHLSCLRKWQRMVLVDQPTHPAYWEDDERHVICNVCKGNFTCLPPTRKELMEGFTGPEVAELIRERSIICTSEKFMKEIKEQTESMGFGVLAAYHHWIEGVYLITKVEKGTGGRIELAIETEDELDRIKEKVDESGDTIQVGKKTYKIVSPIEMGKIVLQDTHLINDDTVYAVNLQKFIREEQETDMTIRYYRSGPVDSNKIVSCIVRGGRFHGYTVVNSIQIAKRLINEKFKKNKIGLIATLEGLQNSASLNGESGIIMYKNEDQGEQQGRYEILMLKSNQIKKVLPKNVKIEQGQNYQIMAFQGHAVWTRVQLMAEIAKGSWGLTPVLPAIDLIQSEPYNQVLPRLIHPVKTIS